MIPSTRLSLVSSCFFKIIFCPAQLAEDPLQQATSLYSRRQDHHAIFYGVCLVVGVNPEALRVRRPRPTGPDSYDIRCRPNHILTW